MMKRNLQIVSGTGRVLVKPYIVVPLQDVTYMEIICAHFCEYTDFKWTQEN